MKKFLGGDKLRISILVYTIIITPIFIYLGTFAISFLVLTLLNIAVTGSLNAIGFLLLVCSIFAIFGGGLGFSILFTFFSCRNSWLKMSKTEVDNFFSGTIIFQLTIFFIPIWIMSKKLSEKNKNNLKDNYMNNIISIQKILSIIFYKFILIDEIVLFILTFIFWSKLEYFNWSTIWGWELYSSGAFYIISIPIILLAYFDLSKYANKKIKKIIISSIIFPVINLIVFITCFWIIVIKNRKGHKDKII